MTAESLTAVIRGTVTDPSGRPVPHVRIEVEPGGRVVRSDAKGSFVVGALAAGAYSVTAVSEHFEAATVSPLLLSTGGELQVTLQFRKLSTSRVQLDVIGEEPELALREIPGSAHLIDSAELAARRPMDANEVLRSVPGVHVREDSGPVGMRMNIGIRGLNPDRSRALLVLEDGLPLSLAPYGEPEMYYSPPIERMSRVELLKGSGSIIHGPQTIGGVLNFVTPDPPARRQGAVELSGGQRGFLTGQVSYGGANGNAGWHINALRKQGDGWRSLYFNINDFTAKLNLALSERQKLGVKLGHYDEVSNSTYLGLTESQFRANPNFNPVPDDLLKLRRHSGSLLHQYVVSPRALLSSSLFAYTTTRNWRRQDFDRALRSGIQYLAILGDPSVPGDAIFLRDSSGNNNREFDVAGAESRLGVDAAWLGVRHRLDAGVRYIYEQHRDRRIDGGTYIALSGVIRSDETRDGNAVSAFLQDRIFLSERFSVTPGLRLERYAYLRRIFRQPVDGIPADVNVRGGDDVFKPIPGIGAAFQPWGPLTVVAGVHRGFAPPRVKDAVTKDGGSLRLDAELSWNYEAGARLDLTRGLRAESTFFATDFGNQIIPAAQSGGATTTLINGGQTLHRGVEVSAHADWSLLAGIQPGFYTELRHTYLPTARFTSGIFNGNRLPYAPRHLSGLRAGYRHPRGFSMHIDGARVSAQFADNAQTRTPSSDGTVGLVPACWIWNLSAGQEIRRERFTMTPFLTVKNLGDAIYISSRAPQGIQPGMFRQVNAGVTLRF